MNTDFAITNGSIEGVKIITPFSRDDERGYFVKYYEKDVFKSFGIHECIYECFESFSKKNVVRGLHFQISNPQIKMVRVIKGRVNDVVVDLREGSPTFGKWEMFELSSDNKRMLYVPAGFAHGFETLEDTIMSYTCINKYSQGTDVGIKWNDSRIGISWQSDNPIVSERDNNLISFEEFVATYKALKVVNGNE